MKPGIMRTEDFPRRLHTAHGTSFIIICKNLLMLVMLIIVGQSGGNYYTNKGGGTNYLCLPNDPKKYFID
jgi:hypothetical protein